LQKAKAAAAVMETRATIRKPAIALGLMAKESFPVSQVGKGRRRRWRGRGSQLLTIIAVSYLLTD